MHKVYIYIIKIVSRDYKSITIELARSTRQYFLTAKLLHRRDGQSDKSTKRSKCADLLFYRIYGGRKLLKKGYAPEEISGKARGRKGMFLFSRS